MNIDDYKDKAKLFCYEEEKIVFSHPEEYLNDFIEYHRTNLHLKIYLAELIIFRHFMPGGAMILPQDVDWFITQYFSTYESDLVEPMRTKAIIAAKDMIMSEDVFGKETVGTVFMFSIIEFYTKYKLGFRPHKYDFF